MVADTPDAAPNDDVAPAFAITDALTCAPITDTWPVNVLAVLDSAIAKIGELVVQVVFSAPPPEMRLLTVNVPADPLP